MQRLGLIDRRHLDHTGTAQDRFAVRIPIGQRKCVQRGASDQRLRGSDCRQPGVDPGEVLFKCQAAMK